MTAPVEFLVRVRTKNQNAQVPNSKKHAMILRRIRTKEHEDAAMTTRAALARAGVHPSDLVPCTVRLWRVTSARPKQGRDTVMDFDGIVSACKWVRDGIAEVIGVDDGSRLISFRYGEYLGKRGQFGVIVRLERRQA